MAGRDKVNRTISASTYRLFAEIRGPPLGRSRINLVSALRSSRRIAHRRENRTTCLPPATSGEQEREGGQWKGKERSDEGRKKGRLEGGELRVAN